MITDYLQGLFSLAGSIFDKLMLLATFWWIIYMAVKHAIIDANSKTPKP